MRILALGAHPDDIEIFMGGSMLAWANMGAELHFVIATDGAKGGAAHPTILSQQRADEARQAAELLGATLHLLNWADGALPATTQALPTLNSLFANLDPDLIVTHATNDYHADHRQLSLLASSAAGFHYPLLFCDTLAGTGFQPQYYIDTSAYIEQKCAAIRCHQSQDPERFVSLSRQQAAWRSQQCGVAEGYAEAFATHIIYPFADIRNLLPPAPRFRAVAARNDSTTHDPANASGSNIDDGFR